MTYPHPMDDRTGFEATDEEMGLPTGDREMTAPFRSAELPEGETYELTARDHKALARAISYYLGHLQTTGSLLRASGGSLPTELTLMSSDLDELYRRIATSTSIKIEWD
jgi:hypothetical protein